jgi:ATP-dependent Clp protease, protease subunit
MRHYPPTLRDEDPEEPGQPGKEERKPAEPAVAELESRLLKGRKVMIFGQVTDKLARDVVARILALADESSKPIQIYVHSPGGHVESGDTIYDIIKFINSSLPIYMIGTGWVASAGALIYAAGEKKLRFCLPKYTLPAASADGRYAGPCHRHRH